MTKAPNVSLDVAMRTHASTKAFATETMRACMVRRATTTRSASLTVASKAIARVWLRAGSPQMLTNSASKTLTAKMQIIACATDGSANHNR